MAIKSSALRSGLPLRPATYARISDDRLSDELGIRRQLKENQARADRDGWPMLRAFVDNDISAYSGKARPAYRELVAAIKAGEVDGLVVWHVDRLYRRLTELEELIDLLDARPRFPIITVTAGDIDLSTASGRMVARTLATMARYESEHKAERIRAKHRELALAGEGKGGGTRPFGFNPDRLTVNKEEAALVRQAAKAVLAGATLRSVCADWNRREIPTVTGTRWSTTVLRRLLTAPRTAGLREHRGETVADATWSAILDRPTHEKMRAILLDPGRTRRRRPASRYLLTGGTARCALCGAALVARPRGDGARCYVCATGPGFSGCGKIRILAGTFEEFVTEAVMLALDTPKLATQLKKSEPVDDATAEIAAAEGRLVELAGMWAAGEIRRSEWLTARKGLESRLEAARARVSRSAGSQAAAPFLGRPGALRKAWDQLDLDRRRAVVSAVVDRVVVGSAVRGLNRFDPSRLEVIWRV